MKINPKGKIQSYAWVIPILSATVAFIYIFHAIGYSAGSAWVAFIVAIPAFGLGGLFLLIFFPLILRVPWDGEAVKT